MILVCTDAICLFIDSADGKVLRVSLSRLSDVASPILTGESNNRKRSHTAQESLSSGYGSMLKDTPSADEESCSQSRYTGYK